MTDEQVMQYIGSLVLNDAERKALNDFNPKYGYSRLFAKDYRTMEVTKISARKVGILSNMFEYYLDGIGQQHITGTAWGAYNAVTGYYSNVDNSTGEDRMKSMLYGRTGSVMTEALNIAHGLTITA